MKKFASLLVIMMLMVTPMAAADPSPWTSETGYSNKVTSKLFFGLKNLALGWTEIFQEPSDGGDGWKGVGRGLVHTVAYTVGGAIHTATFLIPVDLPLADGGV